MRQYFYEIDGVEHGPVPYSELVKLRLPRDSKVWFEGLGLWMRADKMPALKEVPLSAARNSVGIATGQRSSYSILDADFDVEGKPQNYRIPIIVVCVLSLMSCGLFSFPVAVTGAVFSFVVDSKYRDGFYLSAENFSLYTKITLFVAGGLVVFSLAMSALSFLF